MRRLGGMLALAALALVAGCVPPPIERAGDYPPERRPTLPPPQVEADTRLPGPPPRPAWEARPVTPDAVDVVASDYVVVAGDTLRAIANRTGAGTEAIGAANGLIPPYTVYVGQRLHIPAGRYHLVRPGETGIAIARAYGVPWAQIVAANDLFEPYVLRAGRRIIIPRSGATPPSAAERAAAFHLDIDDIVTGSEPALAANTRPAPPTSSPTRILPPEAAIAAPPRRTGGFGWPITGNVVRRFGPGGTGERMDGIKIAARAGTPVLATADGVILYVGDGVPGLGSLVMVKHSDGWVSVYGHNSQLLVQRGQVIRRGQTIALSGESGTADRPELHFELRKGRTPVDPLTQLPAR